MPDPAALPHDPETWPNALTRNQAARLLNVNTSTVRRMVQAGVLEELDYAAVKLKLVTKASVMKVLKLEPVE